jgi:hypothetical protein
MNILAHVYDHARSSSTRRGIHRPVVDHRHVIDVACDRRVTCVESCVFDLRLGMLASFNDLKGVYVCSTKPERFVEPYMAFSI